MDRAKQLVGGVKKTSSDEWLVLSSAKDKEYAVKNPQMNQDPENYTCSCEDFQFHKSLCKHIGAVVISQHKQELPDAATVMPVTIDLTEDDVTEVEPEMKHTAGGGADSRTIAGVELQSDDTGSDISVDYLQELYQPEQMKFAVRWAQVRDQWFQIQFLDEAPLRLVELAVSVAWEHRKERSRTVGPIVRRGLSSSNGDDLSDMEGWA